MSKPKAVGYIRFSSAGQKDGSSVERQEVLIKQAAEKHGLWVTQIFSDLGVSSFKGDNFSGALGDLIKYVKTNADVEYLLVEDFDRLSREGIWKAAPRLGDLLRRVKLITTNTGQIVDLSLMSDSLMTLLKAELANQESAKKSQRIIQAHDAAVKNGKYIAKIPYGYIRDNKKNIHIHPEHSKVILKIFTMFADGDSYRGIAKHLNEQGISPPNGETTHNGIPTDKIWFHTTIQKIIKEQHRVYGAGTAPTKRNEAGIPNVFPIILPEDIYARVLSHLNTAKQEPTKVSSGETGFLFSGLLKCSECGSTVSRRITNKKKGWVYLVCNGQINHKGCMCKPLPKPHEIEASILLSISDLICHDLSEIVSNINGKVEDRLEDARKNKDRLEKEVFLLTKQLGDIITYAASLSPEMREAAETRMNELSSILTEKKRILNEITNGLELVGSSTKLIHWTDNIGEFFEIVQALTQNDPLMMTRWENKIPEGMTFVRMVRQRQREGKTTIQELRKRLKLVLRKLISPESTLDFAKREATIILRTGCLIHLVLDDVGIGQDDDNLDTQGASHVQFTKHGTISLITRI